MEVHEADGVGWRGQRIQRWWRHRRYALPTDWLLTVEPGVRRRGVKRARAGGVWHHDVGVGVHRSPRVELTQRLGELLLRLEDELIVDVRIKRDRNVVERYVGVVGDPDLDVIRPAGNQVAGVGTGR